MKSPAPRVFTPEYYARMRDLENRSWWNAAMRDIAVMLLSRAHIPARGMMLDAGCGSGQTMSWFIGQWPKWSATGVDVALDALAAARHAGLTVQRASILALPFPNRSFDLVLTQDVLQHLPLDGGDQTALMECARVLRVGGTILVRTNAQTIPRAEDDLAFSFRKYEPHDLRAKLEVAGFEVIILGRVNVLPGLAEIPRDLRANRNEASSYHGILGDARGTDTVPGRLLRGWLGLEGRALAAGWQLPLGRTMFALCRAK
jgi:SAM-dependent methyltransferase